MKRAFHGLRTCEADQRKLGISTHLGNYVPQAIPEGITSGSGLLQHVVNEVFEPILHRSTVMQDNILVGIAANEDPEPVVRQVLELCLKYNVKLSWLKSEWLVDDISFWGYHITPGRFGISPTRKAAPFKQLYFVLVFRPEQVCIFLVFRLEVRCVRLVFVG